MVCTGIQAAFCLGAACSGSTPRAGPGPDQRRRSRSVAGRRAKRRPSRDRTATPSWSRSHTELNVGAVTGRWQGPGHALPSTGIEPIVEGRDDPADGPGWRGRIRPLRDRASPPHPRPAACSVRADPALRGVNRANSKHCNDPNVPFGLGRAPKPGRALAWGRARRAPEASARSRGAGRRPPMRMLREYDRPVALIAPRGAAFSAAAFWMLAIGADATAIVLASMATGVGYHAAVYGTPGNLGDFARLGVVSAWLFVVLNMWGEEYRFERYRSLGRHPRRVTHRWAVACALTLAFAFLTKSSEVYSRGWLVLFFAGGFAAVCVGRAVPILLMRAAQNAGLVA